MTVPVLDFECCADVMRGEVRFGDVLKVSACLQVSRVTRSCCGVVCCGSDVAVA